MADSYPATVLADNPIAYYRFEELPGDTVVHDSSASGAYLGTYYFEDSGAYPKLGDAGITTNSALFHIFPNLSGSPRAEIPFSADLNPSGPFSVELWLRPTSVPDTGYRCPISNWGGNGDAYAGWFVYQSGTGWIWIQRVGDIWLDGGPATKFQWTHFVASFDGTNVYVYSNGQLRSQKNAANAGPNTAQPLYLGFRNPTEFLYDGNIDEVALYTNALTLTQIQTHYQVGLTNIRVALSAPAITADPANATVYAGHTATFTAGADGTAPLGYQWFRNSVPITDATNDTLSFTCAYGDNGSTYRIAVTNIYGAATSAVATLTVSTDLLLTASPNATSRTAGGMAAFRVIADGALPYNYQWYKGATPLPGATNQMLWLSNVQLTDDNTTYYVRVTNPYGGATNSEPATLNVTARTTPAPSLSRYGLVVGADQPVAYWRLDQTDASAVAVDAAGGFDGNFNNNNGAGTFTYGAPTGIPHETNPALGVSGGATVQIPYALELNPYGPFSVEAWVNPTTVASAGGNARSAMGSLGNGDAGPTGWHLYQEVNGAGDSHWSLLLWANSWGDLGWFTDLDDAIVPNTWYHVVIAYDGDLFRLYVNNVERIALPFAHYIPNSDSAMLLGWGYSPKDPFTGVIDDVAVYNRALTPDQIQAHYLASVRLTVTKAGNQAVLSWPFGTLQSASAVGGAYTDLTGITAPYTNSPTSTRFFRVKAY